MQLNREKLFIPLSIAVISLAFIVIGSLLANLILGIKNHQNALKENEPKNDHLIMTENHSTDHSNVMENKKKTTKVMEKGQEYSTTEPKSRKICKTPECFRISAQLQSWRDDRVNPCDDFYQYSCGRYVEMEDTVEGPMRSKSVSVMETLREFSLTNSPSTSSKSEQTIKNLFSTCEQQNENKTARNENLIDLYADIQKIGSFPIFDENWNESAFDLNQILENMAKMHLMNLGVFGVFPGPEELLIGPDYSLGKEGNSEKKIKNIIEGLFKVTNPNVTESEIKQAKKDFDDAEILAETIENRTPTNDSDDDDHSGTTTTTSNVHSNFDETSGLGVPFFTTLSNLTSKITIFDFERILKAMISPKNGNWEKLKMNIQVHNHSLFFENAENIEKLLEKFSKRDLANFLVIHFIRQITLSYSGDCLEMVTQALPKATLRIYVQHFFKKENLKMSSHLVEELKQMYIEKFQKSTWLDEKTRENAILKVEKMQYIIGYPEEFEAPGTLDAIFEEMLDIHPDDSFYVMNRKISRFQTEQYMNYATFGGKLDPNFDLLPVNAQYDPERNFLIMFLAFMDDPFLDPSFPLFVTMANAGNTLGHEIGHGFDDNGRTYDENGEENDWWTSEASDEYDRRMGCLGRQFDNYEDRVYGKKLDSAMVILEIIADHLGNDISWMTYAKMNSSTESVGIVGLEDVPDDQLFFQMSAQNWCAYRSRESLEEAQTNVHPPGVFRVNGALSNMKSFAETFNCPVGSPMNPKNKCEIF